MILTAAIMSFQYPQKLTMYRTNHFSNESTDKIIVGIEAERVEIYKLWFGI
jgi:hypothetical protein